MIHVYICTYIHIESVRYDLCLYRYIHIQSIRYDLCIYTYHIHIQSIMYDLCIYTYCIHIQSIRYDLCVYTHIYLYSSSGISSFSSLDLMTFVLLKYLLNFVLLKPEKLVRTRFCSILDQVLPLFKLNENHVLACKTPRKTFDPI